MKPNWMKGWRSRRIRFWERVHKIPGGCWLWTGYVNPQGYGTVSYLHEEGRTWVAHRLAWTLCYGKIPEGKHLDHLCEVRHCVNPKHLEVVEPAENSRRVWKRESATVGLQAQALAAYIRMTQKERERFHESIQPFVEVAEHPTAELAHWAAGAR